MSCTESEDKKCRICGLADKSNISIFKDEILQMKISAVYPIVLFEDSPLPRNICRKCVTTVNTSYNDIQRVLKLQCKWIQNVRVNEPQNNFIQVLDLLEHATEAIKNLIVETFGAPLLKETINSRITTALSNVPKQSGLNDAQETPPLNGLKIKDEPTSNDEEKVKNFALPNTEAIQKSISSTCPLLTVTCRYCSLVFDSLAKLSLHQNVHLKVRVPKIFRKKFLNKKSRRGRLIAVNDRQSIRCLNCWRIFDDNKCILEHWSKGECDFYCQICGKEFEHSPKMLREHVSVTHGISYKSLKGQRDRFNKKILIKTKNKYRTEVQKNKDSSTITVPQIKCEPSSTELVNFSTANYQPHLNKQVVCRICSRTFQNFKACNSHMRAHKPPYAYGETAPLPHVDADAYTEIEHEKNMENKCSAQLLPQCDFIQSSSCQIPVITMAPAPVSHHSIKIEPHSIHNEPVSTISNEIKVENEIKTTENTSIPQAPKRPTSTAPRGIRMKFVTRRSDLNGSIPNIKVKSLNDLQGTQRNEVTSQPYSTVTQVQNALPAPYAAVISNASNSNIKNEPVNNMLL